MENHVFMKAKTREEYMNMVAKLILHVREMSPKQNQGAPNMQGPNQNQQGPNAQVQMQGQGQQSNQPGAQQDPINALQTLASQGTRNQMMNMGPQGQMQQQGLMGPNQMGGMQAQMQQGPIVSQGAPAQAASNLLQTLNQRPQMNMQLQQKLAGPMGMVGGQGQMGSSMGMSHMNPMGSQLQNQLQAPGMQPQMMPNMSMPNTMPVSMSGSNNMVGQMPCNQVGMGGHMAPNNMQAQMSGQMVGGMSNNQMVNLNLLQMNRGVGGKQEVGVGVGVGAMMGGGYGPRPSQPTQFLRQSPSPSAPSPNMGGGPSPGSMGVMSGAMPSPMSTLSGLAGCGGVGSPSPSGPPHLSHHVTPQQRGVGMGMVASPVSSLNTPVLGLL